MNIQSHFFKAVARLLIVLMCMQPVHSLAAYGDGGRAEERGHSSDQAQKRLGDGLYEQRLIEQAITARTGKRFLDGLTSNDAQFRYLMDNGLASKEALNLSVGISLTAEQVAALTHDIVWMEEREVQGEKVLVPVVYLAQATDRVATTGALIQGQDLTLISGAGLENSGVLRASNSLTAYAERISNTGLIQTDGWTCWPRTAFITSVAA